MQQRLKNDNLARLLHDQLYNRMIAFCEQYTPEIPAKVIVTSWLNRLFTDDDNLHILVKLDDNYRVMEHAVIDVQDAFGCKVVFCHQAYGDKHNSSGLDKGMEYIRNLVITVGAHCSVFTVSKHIRGFEKKYGYKTTRTIMVKYAGDVDEAE